MKVVENNRYIWLHLSFLRYLTGGSGMISGSFFWRPFIKIFIFRFTTSLFMFLHHGKFPRNFAETYEKSWEFFKNISEFFPRTPYTYSPTQSPIPTPTSPPIPYPHWNFKLVFLDNGNVIKSTDYFPSPSLTYLIECSTDTVVLDY